MKKEGQEWVAVTSVGNDEEALLIAGFLRSQGIPCEVEGPSAATPLPENLGAFGMSRIMVPPDRAAEAGQLLASREGGKESDSGEE
ncbi:MAG: DUF2007 domain-containing protein [Acidobacteriota bacterium]|nr:DUF2007 domain-containing protein [Acidobacteriota bacterium]